MKTLDIGAASCILHRIQTTVDGGIQITLSLSSQDVELAQKLMQIKTINPLVTVAFVQQEAPETSNEISDANDDWKKA